MNDTKLKLWCWAHDMQRVIKQAVKGKHKGEYKLECGCWRGATVSLRETTEEAT